MGRKIKSKSKANGNNPLGDVGDYFNASHQINKYRLDHSTFDIIDVDRFHNTDTSTVLSYILTWILMFLSWVLLGVDMYTCLSILVFHKWSSESYKPYAYAVAKWIFTGCIIFEFCLLIYHWVWAIHTYKTRNIALAYVNKLTRILYIVRSYNYHCLFNKIEHNNKFDWACFLAYGEIDHALQILFADTPRQVINILTLRYYATSGDTSNDIILNIKDIADTNIMLSIILSFMVLSVMIWSIFFFKFLLGMILYIPVKIKLKEKDFKSLKKYCCTVVNDNVRILVFKHHKPKNELIEKGILDPNDIRTNPLLSSSTTTFGNDGFSYRGIPNNSSTSSLVPKSSATTTSGLPYRNNDNNASATDLTYRYNDNKKLYSIANGNNSNTSLGNQSYESLPLDDFQSRKPPSNLIPRSTSNLNNVYNHDNSSNNSINPFSDNNQLDQQTQKLLVRKPPPSSRPMLVNPFLDQQINTSTSSLNSYIINQQPQEPRQLQQSKLSHKDSMNTINTSSYTIDQDSFSSQQLQQNSLTQLPNSQSSLSFTNPPIPLPTKPRNISLNSSSNKNNNSMTTYDYQQILPEEPSILDFPSQQLPHPSHRTTSQNNSSVIPRSTSLSSDSMILPRSDSQFSGLSYPINNDEEINNLSNSNSRNLSNADHDICFRSTSKSSHDDESFTNSNTYENSSALKSKQSQQSLSYDKFTANSVPYPIPEPEPEPKLNSESSLIKPPSVNVPYPVRGVSMFDEEVDDETKNKLSNVNY